MRRGYDAHGIVHLVHYTRPRRGGSGLPYALCRDVTDFDYRICNEAALEVATTCLRCVARIGFSL